MSSRRSGEVRLGRRTWAWCPRCSLGTLGLLLLACVGAVDPRSGEETSARSSHKIDIDAVTRATPRRLRGPLKITDIATFEALSFDPRRQPAAALTYELSRPAWVRIRHVARRDPRLVLRTLVDWSPRELGENSELWDGRDASGHWIDRRDCPGLFLIEGDSPEHAQHDRELCGDPKLRISTPRPNQEVGGHVGVDVFVRDTPRGYLSQSGGSMQIYADCRLVAERRVRPGEREPFTLEWESGALTNGPHVLSVNLEDGYDHVGTASVEVEVRRR